MVTVYLQFLMLLVSLFYGTGWSPMKWTTDPHLSDHPACPHSRCCYRKSWRLLPGVHFMIYHSVLLTYFVLYSMKGWTGSWPVRPSCSRIFW